VTRDPRARANTNQGAEGSSASTDLALLRRFPELVGRLWREPFVAAPTPVSSLPGFAAGVEVFVKHDERCCSRYGGNKPRKLEFVIGAAVRRGSRRLVTVGGLGTNHGLATTILARSVGLAATVVLVDQPVTADVERNLLLSDSFGADLVYGRTVAGVARRTAVALVRSAARGERPTFVPTGGSSARGNLGFVSAGLELAEQVARGELPAPDEIFVPVGSGGTAVGLVVGLRIAGLRSRVRGVLVTDILPPTPRRLARAARATLAGLRRLAASVPPVSIGPGDFPLCRDQLGPGYGAPTAAARDAVGFAAEHGLALETTYSAKCLAALRERARHGSPGPVVFWNTYNAVDVERSAPRPTDPRRLSPQLRDRLRSARARE